MNIAGYCESCDRWFACVDDDIDRFVCARCGRRPILLKSRPAARRRRAMSMVGAARHERGR